jgi:hypothetical protein
MKRFGQRAHGTRLSRLQLEQSFHVPGRQAELLADQRMP